MIATEPLPVASIALADYASVQGQAEVDELRALARPLRHRTVQMVNSTREIMAGIAPFFEVTKAFHNALHGAPTPIGRRISRLLRRPLKRTWRACRWMPNSW